MLTNFQRFALLRWALVLCGATVLLTVAGIAFGESIYILKPGVTNRDISDNDAKRPTVAGVTYRVPWAVLNPRRTSFDFTEVQEGVSQANRIRKPMKLIVQTGRGGASPKWIGGKWMSDGAKDAPVPWSPELEAAPRAFSAFSMLWDRNCVAQDSVWRHRYGGFTSQQIIDYGYGERHASHVALGYDRSVLTGTVWRTLPYSDDAETTAELAALIAGEGDVPAVSPAPLIAANILASDLV